MTTAVTGHPTASSAAVTASLILLLLSLFCVDFTSSYGLIFRLSLDESGVGAQDSEVGVRKSQKVGGRGNRLC